MKKALKSVLYIGCILILYEIASKIVNKSLFLPSLGELVKMFGTLSETNVLFKHLGSSFLRVTAGVLIASAISIPLGMAIAWYKPVRAIFKPIVDSLRNIPPTCFSPILVLILGIDESMKITYVAIAVAFSFLPTVIQTCMDPAEKLKETAYTMGFNYNRMLLHCFIPYITPSLIKAIILSYSVGWTYVILAEVNNTQYGLGHLMYIGSARGKMAMVFASMIIIVVVGIVFDKIANKIVNKAFAWRFNDEKESAAG